MSIAYRQWKRRLQDDRFIWQGKYVIMYKRKERVMKRNIIVMSLVIIFLAGCDSFRFAPGEFQRQNAWLHNRTAAVAADIALSEDTSESLQRLTALSELQSRAFTADYGLPKEYPAASTPQEILAQSSYALADSAISHSQARPDVWDMADATAELGIGIAGIFGGVYGIRLAGFLRKARAKSKALREVIEGNEIFKRQNADSQQAFKMAQNSQSAKTRQIVAEMKNV